VSARLETCPWRVERDPRVRAAIQAYSACLGPDGSVTLAHLLSMGVSPALYRAVEDLAVAKASVRRYDRELEERRRQEQSRRARRGRG
jgi:hypothetical protein